MKGLTSIRQWFGYRAAAIHFFMAMSFLSGPFGAMAIGADQDVTITADSGAGSLRQAIIDVGDGENVIFQPTVAGGTISLLSGLDVTKSMNFINNSGGDVTAEFVTGVNIWMEVTDEKTISIDSGLTFQKTATGADTAFTIHAPLVSDDITIDGLHGTVRANSVDGWAGPIWVAGTLDIDDLSGTVEAESTNSYARGLGANSDLNITGGMSGIVRASGNNGTNGTVGIYSRTAINIDGGLSGTVEAIDTDQSAQGLGSTLNDISITGGLSGTVRARSTNGAADGLFTIDGAISITGGLSGTVEASSDTARAAGLWNWEEGVSIADGLSGTITATSITGTAYGINTNGDINGGDVNTALVITGSGSIEAVGATTVAAIMSRSGGIDGQINLKLDEGGTLSAISTGGGSAHAVISSSSLASTVELVAGCTVVGDISLGIGTGDLLTLSGASGTTAYAGDISRVETINATGGTWDLSGDIAVCAAALNVSGGTVTLSGTNGYYGGTNVSGGTLFVDGLIGLITDNTTVTGGILGGTGQVDNLTIDNGGTFAPGHAAIGTLTVDGSYTQNAGSTIEVEINAAGTTPGVNNDLVDISGTATINGGTVDVQADPSGTYNVSMVYTFLDADGGVTGTYDGITDNISYLEALLRYDGNQVQIIFEQSHHFIDDARTFNQRSVAGYLDDHVDGATGDFFTVLNELGFLSPDDARNAFDQMDGEIYGTLGNVGVQGTTLVYYTLMNRLRPDLSVCRSACWGCRDDCSKWDSWAIGYGLGGNASADGNAHGFGYSIGGTLVGLDRYLSPDDRAGMFFAYGRTHVGLNGLSASANVDNCLLGGYFTRESCRDYFTLAGGFGIDSYAVRRNIEFGEISRTDLPHVSWTPS